MTMSASVNNPSLFVEHKRLEGILKNKDVTSYWGERKKAHEELQKNLEYYAGKLQEQIMVPIGKRGLMKGRIVNTNQVFVSLGGGWFIKTCSAKAQKVCKRRILECNEMLDKLEKERKLLEGWTALSGNQVFATEGCKEIIEPYDEKEEESWRKKHDEKVKEHKRKLAEVRQEIAKSKDEEKSTDENLWKHLELLELQEEFEDELNRLGENSESESEDDDSSPLDSDDDSSEDYDRITNQENYIIVENKTVTGLQSILSKNNKDDLKKSKPTTSTKRISFAELPDIENENDTVEVMSATSSVNNNVAIGDVTEHIIDTNNVELTASRPVSKFKSSRQSNKK